MSRDELPPVNGIPRPKTLRQSVLRLADQCPRSAYLAWKLDGGPTSNAMFRGTVFHETAARITNTLIELGEQRIDQNDAKAILDEVLLEHPEWVVQASDMDMLRMMVWRFSECFRCPSAPLVEQLFHLAVRDSVVSGTVDLAWVDGDTLYLRDWKTGPGFSSHDDISGKDETGTAKGAKAFQLIVYTLLMADGKAIARDWRLPGGVENFNVAFVYPYHQSGDGEGMLERGVTITRPELIEHRAWLNTLIARVEHGFETGRWPAVPGDTCRVCPGRHECPLPAEYRKGIHVGQDPSESAEEYMFMASDVDALRKDLKAVAAEQGPIPIGDTLELSHKRVDSRRMTKRGKELLEQGLPVPSEEYTTSESTKFGIHPKGSGF